MDGFTIAVFAGIGVLVLVLFFLGSGSQSGGMEQLGLRSAREIMSSREELEAEDLAQMLAAHNARRAARGQAEVSADEIELQWMREEGEMARERDAARRRASGEPPAPGSRWDALD